MDKLIEFLNNNEVFIKIVEENKESNYPITTVVIHNNKTTLAEFADQYIKCESGPLYSCKQFVKGMQSKLSYRDSKFYITYLNCAHFIYENRNSLIKSNYKYVDFNVDSFPNTVKNYLEKIDQSPIFNDQEKSERKLLIKSAGAVIHNYLQDPNNNQLKGYYIWGSPGIGKTNILRTLSNEAAIRGAKVVFCTAPTIIEIVKEQFSDKERTQKKLMKNLKECKVLFIDDFGGEMVSQWSRDNFWFNVFNYRMDHHKLTFFTSNFSPSELDNLYLMKGVLKNMELKKVERLKERVRALSSVYNLKGEKSKRNLN